MGSNPSSYFLLASIDESASYFVAGLQLEAAESGVPKGMDKSKQITYGLGGLGVLLGGLGVFLLSERGREIISNVIRHLERAPASIAQFADATQLELDRIQQTLNQIAARLQVIG
jgi:hypothetical protein